MTLVFEEPAAGPGTHVLIIGVGAYPYGRGSSSVSPVGRDVAQLTSPPTSARAIADWFISSYRKAACPLASVAMLLSETNPLPYAPPRPVGAPSVIPPAATLEKVRSATRAWADRLRSHKENLAVFYFCGHGVSVGQQAALLLADFGEPGREFEGAVDLDVLCGTMRNARTVRQAYLLDCCRTRADDLYRDEPRIGSRIVSEPAVLKDHNDNAQQFVLFPTIDGEEAFGAPNAVSAFTGALIDALDFAAADPRSGAWRTSTARLLAEVDQLISYRVPPQLRTRSKPSAVDAINFDFNDISPPTTAKSFVTISDPTMWTKDVTIACQPRSDGAAPPAASAADHPDITCCTFDLAPGEWEFTGTLTAPHEVGPCEQIVAPPVAYVTLTVAS